MRFPVLRLNSEKAKANIKRMALKARELNLEFRPHFKTHQSVEIGNWFREYGVHGITVASLSMAEYFAKAGWDDITIAFPVSLLDMSRIEKLSSICNVKFLINNLEVANYLEKHISKELSLYIEIDPLYGRSGVSISNNNEIHELVEFVKKSINLHFVGFYSHAGQSYKCQGKEDIRKLTVPLISKISLLKEKFGGKLCWGDTPSCSILESFGNIDQISPGNFVFYDWMQSKIGSCSSKEIAVKMLCPVVAKFNDRQEVLIHGGAVHFSKEFILQNDDKPNFGQVYTPGFDNESSYLKSVSQEHGIVTCSKALFRTIKVGDVLEIFPIHSCLTANLMGAYSTESGELIDHFASGAPFKG